MVIDEISGYAGKKVALDDSIDSLGLDSLELLDLLVQLGIPDSELSQMNKVSDLVDYISARNLG